MSLQALSTELDVIIISHLDKQDLSRMSRTSKHYRRISEPLLYGGICIGSDGHDRIKQLLITLISRKDLRKLIQYFYLYHADNHDLGLPRNHPSVCLPEAHNGDTLYDRLCAHVAEITETMDNVAQRYCVLSQSKNLWLASIFRPYPLFDGALSLILCLAHNLKAIRLDMCTRVPLSKTRCVLQDINWHTAEVMTPEIPFQRLTNADFKCIRNSTFIMKPLFYLGWSTRELNAAST